MYQLDREHVIGFRLAAHHLDDRLPQRDLLTAAGQCGIQNSPPRSAILAFHARVDGITPELMTEAIENTTLLQTWCMRGSPYYIPTSAADVFTAGVLPASEDAKLHFVLGVEQSIDRLEMSLTEAVGLVTAATLEVLSGRQLTIHELGAEVAEWVAPELTPSQRHVWREEGPYAKGQPIGEAVVHFCIRILSLQQVVCFAPRTGNKAPFVLTEEWLGHPVAPSDAQASRAELLRRYLRSYGPSTRKAFAAWLGVRAGDVDPWWNLLDDELLEVDFGGPAWLLAADFDRVRAATLPTGIRLLPPKDPYMQLRDRDTVVDKAYQRDVWKTAGDPGTILWGGEIVGTWRPRKKGRKLHIEFKTFATLEREDRDALVVEAERIAPFEARHRSQLSSRATDTAPR